MRVIGLTLEEPCDKCGALVSIEANGYIEPAGVLCRACTTGALVGAAARERWRACSTCGQMTNDVVSGGKRYCGACDALRGAA